MTQGDGRHHPVLRPAGQARTRFARAAVVAAAQRLFIERGYGVATIEAISEAADVPVATVYRLFSSKAGILKALVDVSIVGDDEDLPLADRPEVQSLLSDPDARNQLAGFVKVAAHLNGRIAPIYRVLVSAAGSDRDAAALLDQLTRQRQEGQALIAGSLARSGRLLPELRERDAADIIHALMSPEIYQLLVLDRRWSPDRYVGWLSRTLADQLLSQRSTEEGATSHG